MHLNPGRELSGNNEKVPLEFAEIDISHLNHTVFLKSLAVDNDALWKMWITKEITLGKMLPTISTSLGQVFRKIQGKCDDLPT